MRPPFCPPWLFFCTASELAIWLARRLKKEKEKKKKGTSRPAARSSDRCFKIIRLSMQIRNGVLIFFFFYVWHVKWEEKHFHLKQGFILSTYKQTWKEVDRWCLFWKYVSSTVILLRSCNMRTELVQSLIMACINDSCSALYILSSTIKTKEKQATPTGKLQTTSDLPSDSSLMVWTKFMTYVSVGHFLYPPPSFLLLLLLWFLNPRSHVLTPTGHIDTHVTVPTPARPSSIDKCLAKSDFAACE